MSDTKTAGKSSKGEGSGADYKKEGWPEITPDRYVPTEWYEKHGLKDHAPVIIEGHAVSPDVSVDQAKKTAEQWLQPCMHITLVNMSSNACRLFVPGAKPGEVFPVEVKPFGVIRGPIEHLLSVGQQGSRFPQFWKIGARGNCNDTQWFEDSSGQKRQTCKFYGCDDHPNMGAAHTIHQAYHYVGSIGEIHADPRDPKNRAAYIPPLYHSDKQIREFMERWDKRILVHAWVASRSAVLDRREADHRARQARGESIPGR
jgi:hypothetical protein